MLAEAAHSAADSVNEVFLAHRVAPRSPTAGRNAPLRHGRERFLWAFLAAVASFLIGGCVFHRHGDREARSAPPRYPAAPVVWIVLAISFAADGASWLQSVRQARRQAKEI